MSKTEDESGTNAQERGDGSSQSSVAAGRAFGKAVLRDARRGAALGAGALQRGGRLLWSRLAAKTTKSERRASPARSPAPRGPESGAPASPPFGRRRLRRLMGAALLSLPVIIALSAAMAHILLPNLEEMGARAEDRQVFEDAHGAPLIIRGAVPSAYAPLDTFPRHLVDAVIAIEDRRFFQHGGIDIEAIARALLRNIRSGGIAEGGSTLTQQLVKISYLAPERSLSRKLHEAILTRQLERRDSKEQILEAYLNSVYLGSGATGVPAAARIYFDSAPEDVTLAQSAALAAMIQAPSVVNPLADLEALRARGALVLDAMEAQGRIDADEAGQARDEMAALVPRPPAIRYGTWFSDWITRSAETLAPAPRGVSLLRTTLEPDLQVAAERIIEQHLAAAGSGAQAALVALRPDGAVAAMVGGRDYGESQFNRAVDALRQPGSTFKTIVYLAALAEGFEPGDRILDRQLDIDGYTPVNFDGRYRGEVTMLDAFAASLNAATVNMAMTVGLDRIAQTARTLGIDTELRQTPALALGASEIPLIEMTEAYGAIATGRIPFEAFGIRSASGMAGQDRIALNPVPGASGPQIDRIMAARQDMATLLRRVIDDGTGRRAALTQPAAGKTGTTQESRDALFIGWSGDLITGVWIGNDDNTPMDGVTGGGLPAQIWSEFMIVGLNLADATTVGGAKSLETTPAPAQCNVTACRRAYRSFDVSDCTFQPYSGPRKLCTR
ncbi:PBP1A family penicillin-binding protein [Profundibacterium mesophilum]|nr:PBP1A family penicillin-binding protein [Profundibacterium mesophilum]